MAITINGTTGIAGIDGSAGTPAIQGTDTNTGEFFPAADTIAWTTGGSERMRVDSSGNVGIGTTSPSTYGNFVVNASSSAKIIARESSLGYQAILYADGGAAFTGSVSNIPMILLTNNTERMRIDTSGNLLVGTTSTFGAGKTNIYYVPGTTTGVSFLPSTNTGSPTPCNFLNAAGTSVGSITTTASATAYNTSSDYRLKNTIAPMTGALTKVQALKPVTYKWNIDDEVGEGFIAHELAKVCPHAVTGEKDAVDENGNPVYQGIDVSFLVATLTAAIQEQQAIIVQLQADVATLKAAMPQG